MSVRLHVRVARTCSISLRSPPALQSLPRHSHRRTAARMSATKDNSSPGHCADTDIPVHKAAREGREGLAPWVPSAGVSIPRPDELRAKLEGFCLSDTHVVADFDFTLTRYWLDGHGGRKGLSSHLLVQRYMLSTVPRTATIQAASAASACPCPCPFPSSRATARVRANQQSCPLCPTCMPMCVNRLVLRLAASSLGLAPCMQLVWCSCRVRISRRRHNALGMNHFQRVRSRNRLLTASPPCFKPRHNVRAGIQALEMTLPNERVRCLTRCAPQHTCHNYASQLPCNE
jgi:hypothetical protein